MAWCVSQITTVHLVPQQRQPTAGISQSWRRNVLCSSAVVASSKHAKLSHALDEPHNAGVAPKAQAGHQCGGDDDVVQDKHARPAQPPVQQDQQQAHSRNMCTW